MTEECSAILQKKLPAKCKDPGSFTIPCTIGNIEFSKALCDLGASINLMPLSIFKKLGLGEPTPTNVSLFMADRSVKFHVGIIENVLVKVDTLVFPVDFLILDMEEDKEVPIILGRPFLATGKALVDVQSEEMKFRFQNDEVKFKMFEALKYPDLEDKCYRIDTMKPMTFADYSEPTNDEDLPIVHYDVLSKFPTREEFLEFLNKV